MVRELWGGQSVCESLPKQRKRGKKGRESLMPLLGNLYPNSGKRPKRVENPGFAFGKSLPKFPIFLIWVENPSTAIRKSLPKQRETGEKGRESHSYRPEISTKIAKICRKGRESQCHRPEISTQM